MSTAETPIIAGSDQSLRAPAVLVGIVTHNRAAVVPKAISSALEQQYGNLNVAVVDDGSTDDTSSVATQFPQTQWTQWTSGQGYLKARNFLMSQTSASYFVSLDDDAWFLEGDEVSIGIEYLETHPNVAAVAFDILSPDRPDKNPRTDAKPVREFIGCGHVLRLSTAREVGFYLASPGPYGSEEKDLSLRLLDRGWEVHLLPGVHVWHDKSQVARDLDEQHRSGVCNDLVFAARRCPMPMLLWIFPLKMFSHIRFAVRRGLLRPCLEGFGLFFQNSVATWRERAPVKRSTFRGFIQRTSDKSNSSCRSKDRQVSHGVEN